MHALPPILYIKLVRAMLRKIAASVKSDPTPEVDLNAVVEKLKAQRNSAPAADNKYVLPSKVHPPIQGIIGFMGEQLESAFACAFFW